MEADRKNAEIEWQRLLNLYPGTNKVAPMPIHGDLSGSTGF